MPATVDADLRAQYEAHGYAVARNVLDHELVGEASEHVEWLMRKYPDIRPENLGRKYIQGDPFWVRLVGDDRLLNVAEAFIGPSIALFASHYICKPPFEGRPVLWHQDGSYWPLDPMEVITLWLAVDDSLPENGCLRVIPGTQHLPLKEMQERSDVDNVLNSEIDPALVDESQAVDLVLRKGDVSIHHPNIIHGSNANHSPLRRCGLTIRYIPTSTRILSETPWECAYLLRGTAIPGINTYQPRPRYVAGRWMPFEGCEAWQ